MTGERPETRARARTPGTGRGLLGAPASITRALRALARAAPVTVAAVVALAAIAVAVVPGPAPAKEAPSTQDQVRLSFAPLVKKVAPAVVNIYSRKVVRSRAASPLFDDPFFRRFFGEDFPFGGTRRGDEIDGVDAVDVQVIV